MTNPLKLHPQTMDQPTNQKLPIPQENETHGLCLVGDRWSDIKPLAAYLCTSRLDKEAGPLISSSAFDSVAFQSV